MIHRLARPVSGVGWKTWVEATQLKPWEWALEMATLAF